MQKKCKSKIFRKLTRLQGSIDLESCIISFPKVHYYKICCVHVQYVVFHLLIWMLIVSVIDKEDKCVYTLLKSDIYCLYCYFCFLVCQICKY